MSNITQTIFLRWMLFWVVYCLTRSEGNVPDKGTHNPGGATTLYMSQHCRTMIWNLLLDYDYVFLDDEAYLMVQPKPAQGGAAFIKQKICVATFAAPPGHQLLLHFLDVAIDHRPQYKSRLYVFDGFNAELHISPWRHGIYGKSNSTNDVMNDLRHKDYLSQSQALTLMFNGYLSEYFYGFKAVLNPVKRRFVNGSCPAHMHQCVKNLHCIDNNLLCNGVPNCGDKDDSDENEMCHHNTGYQLVHTNLDDLGLMIGCGVSILVLLLAVIWVAILIQKRHRLREERHRLRAAISSSPVDNGEPASPTSDTSPWVPGLLRRGMYQWRMIYSGYPDDPPPAYNEATPDQPPAQLVSPPPYTADNERLCVQLPERPPNYSDVFPPPIQAQMPTQVPLLAENSSHNDKDGDEAKADNRGGEDVTDEEAGHTHPSDHVQV